VAGAAKKREIFLRIGVKAQKGHFSDRLSYTQLIEEAEQGGHWTLHPNFSLEHFLEEL
jgi:hypothetical protein